jgi:DUF1365 family protein
MVTAVAAPRVPALVVGTVSHTRRTPLRHAFTYGHYQWLVDLDDLPRFPWPVSLLARFDVRDHLDEGRRGGGIRGDLDRFLARRGVRLAASDRVLMLANARVLGHVFDPLTVYWVLSPAGSAHSTGTGTPHLVEWASPAPVEWAETVGLKAVVLEVHNTYGERHAYLLDVDGSGRATTDKAFYVSPFNDVSGTYAVRLRLERDLVSVSVGLDRDGVRVLTATTSGTPEPATTPALLRTAARHLLMTQRVTALIRFHGIRLWLRRLPVLPRPRHSQEAVR